MTDMDERDGTKFRFIEIISHSSLLPMVFHHWAVPINW